MSLEQNVLEAEFIFAFRAWFEKDGKRQWLNSKEAQAMVDAWNKLNGVKA